MRRELPRTASIVQARGESKTNGYWVFQPLPYTAEVCVAALPATNNAPAGPEGTTIYHHICIATLRSPHATFRCVARVPDTHIARQLAVGPVVKLSSMFFCLPGNKKNVALMASRLVSRIAAITMA